MKEESTGRAGSDGLTLAIDIGNSQTVVGVLEGETVRDLFRLTSGLARTGDELLPIVERLLAPYSDGLSAARRVVIGAVVPAQTPPWEQLVRRLLGVEPFVATVEETRGLTVDVPDPSSVGIDRIANAVAVAARHRLPAIVVDLGTATTFDVVLAGPRYVGGAIAPGIATSAEELFRRAARLAKVDFQRPPSVVGRTTEECIQSGVYFGAIGQIDGLVERICAEIGGTPFVLATGGLAGVIGRDSRTIVEIDPALTLHGLRIMEERTRGALGPEVSRR